MLTNGDIYKEYIKTLEITFKAAKSPQKCLKTHNLYRKSIAKIVVQTVCAYKRKQYQRALITHCVPPLLQTN